MIFWHCNGGITMVTKNTSSFCTYTVFPPEYTPEWIKNTFLSQPTPLLRSRGEQWVDCWNIIMMVSVPSPLFLIPLILLLPTPLLAQSRDSEPLVVTGEQVVFAQNINLDVKIFASFSSFRWICLCLPIFWLASVERQAPGFNCLYRWNILLFTYHYLLVLLLLFATLANSINNTGVLVLEMSASLSIDFDKKFSHVYLRDFLKTPREHVFF